MLQDYTQNLQWKHITSNNNPADSISRGLDAADLINNQLWWYGPKFLTQETCIPESFEAELSQDDKSLILTELKEKFQ